MSILDLADKYFYIYANFYDDGTGETDNLIRKIDPYETAMCNGVSLIYIKKKIREFAEESSFVVAEEDRKIIIAKADGDPVVELYFLPISYMATGGNKFYKIREVRK